MNGSILPVLFKTCITFNFIIKSNYRNCDYFKVFNYFNSKIKSYVNVERTKFILEEIKLRNLGNFYDLQGRSCDLETELNDLRSELSPLMTLDQV